MNLTDLLVRSRDRFPEKPALIIDSVSLTFNRLAEMTESYASRLTGLEVTRGDRVCFFMGNRVELAGLYLACFRLGAVAVPISCYSKPDEVKYAVEHCGGRFLIVEPELVSGVADMASQVTSLLRVYRIGAGGPNEVARFESVTPAPGPLPPAKVLEPSSPAVILYTSGSTGAPKGVTHTVGSLTHSTDNRCAALAHYCDDVYFMTAYLCHGASLTSVFLTMLAVGGTSVFTREFTPPDFLETLRHRRPTVAATAPAQLKAVLEEPSLSREDFRSIRYFHVGGDAVPRELYQAFEDKTGMKLAVAMGMTECGGYLLTPPEGPYKPGSMGRPIPGTEIWLLDENGVEVAPGEIGELVVRTGALMSGYWNDPESTARVIQDGRLMTGDLARCDEDGFAYFAGRNKNIIIRDCGNVAPVEIEDVLNSHPKVKASGAAGVPDGDHGQAVTAFIVPVDMDDPSTVEELEAFTRKLLADRKVPSRWRLVGSIPLTPMAKIDRKALARMAEGKAPLE